MTRHIKGFVRYLRNIKAVSALEYAILVGVIAVAIAAALVTFSGNMTAGMKVIGGKVAAPTVGTPTLK